MKKNILALALGVIAAMAPAAYGADFVNLTPVPVKMTKGAGELTLPARLSIDASAVSADTEMMQEVSKFAATLTEVGIDVAEGAPTQFTVTANPALAEEGYKLTVSASEGVSIEAATPAGLYYAFQTVKKIAGPYMALGKPAPGAVTIPEVTIEDEPRYPWRGMEIDCARHFFSVAQLKKMIDILAVYKINRLHWHLTDDQGWRFEMPKYPKLTTAAAAPRNNYWWDFDNHKLFLTNEQYGPFFYTVEEMKDIVAYAKERHIEVCPEVDLPGHMQAAIAAYPEFSTTPDGEHPVRYWPGVSDDILDVSNPAVVQFTKDIIDELAGIFPYEYIHIGGDECPTTAWANSASCQAFKAEYGLSSDRAIQNWLTKELAEYAREKHSRKLICWNEVITTAGADKQLAKDADLLIYCWLGAGGANNPSKQAADLGLRSVWCSSNHYYLDYPQWSGSSEPNSMGHALTLEHVYNATPDYDAAKKEFYYGVNGNLWTEYIAEDKHLEYNALPRIIAIAETGWSRQAKKNFADFRKRFNADTELLDLGNYTYGRHYVDDSGASAEVVYPEAGSYYRLITQASADANRKDRCIELVHDGCSLIADKGATAGKLWTNVQAAEGSADYDWQYWTFEADPEGSGKYAMVNRMAPEGSVNPTMNGSSVNATWNYDNNAKHYNFLLGEYFSSAAQGYTYTIRSDKGSDHWMNCAQAAQNQRVNNWNKPDDGNGGIWLFSLEGYEPAADNPAFTPLTSGNYIIDNTLGRGMLAVDGNELAVSGTHYAQIGWELTAGEYDSKSNTQTVTLKNLATGLYISGLSDNQLQTTDGIGFGGYANNGGYAILLGETPANITVTAWKENPAELVFSINGNNFYAQSETGVIRPFGVNAYEGSPRKQGATWTVQPVTGAYKATASENGTEVGTFYFYTPGEAALTGIPSEGVFALYEYVSQAPAAAEGAHSGVSVEVKRVATVKTYLCYDEAGTLWATVPVTVPVAQAAQAEAPALNFAEFVRFEGETSGETVTAIYKTEAYKGIAALGERVIGTDELLPGVEYAIEDTHSERHAFRGASNGLVRGVRNAEGASPAHIWILEENGRNFNVRNLATGQYIQALERSVAAKLGDEPYGFRFYWRNSDHWNIKCSGNSLYWDGTGDLSLVGWDNPGHNIQIYRIAAANPYFKLTIDERDQDGELLSTRAVFVTPGSSYVFAANSRPGKALTSVTGNEGLDEILGNKTITVTYTIEKEGINEIHPDQTPGVADAIYDLQGHRLSKASRPGLYIVNGQKTIIR